MTTLVLSDLRRDEAIQPLMKWTLDANGIWVKRPHSLIRTPTGLREIQIKEQQK